MDLAPVLQLVSQSAVHKNRHPTQLARTIVPPMVLGQFRLVTTDAVPVAYISWAFLTDEAANGFKTRTRLLQPTDWNAGDNLWFVDLIAPGGIPRGLRAHLRSLFPKHTRAQWTRTFGTGSVQKIGEINHGNFQAPSGAVRP